MQTRFIGSGDAFGSGGRFQTCIAVSDDERTVLLDCGATSVTAMQAQAFDPGQVDAVVVSHFHADHFGGIPFLVLHGQFNRRTTPLTIVGPPGIEGRVAAAMEMAYPGSSAVERRFDVRCVDLAPGGATHHLDDDLSVRGWEVDHPSGGVPLCLRLEMSGRVVGYSGDTAWTPSLTHAAEAADLFVIESYTYQRTVPYHLSYAAVLEHSEALDADAVVLTHMSNDMLGNLAQAHHAAAFDEMTIDL